MIYIGIIGMILLAGILVCELCAAWTINETDNQLKEIRKQLDELISRQYEWHEEWRAKP